MPDLSKLKIAKLLDCQNYKLPRLKVAKIEVAKIAKIARIKNCQDWKLLKNGNC